MNRNYAIIQIFAVLLAVSCATAVPETGNEYESESVAAVLSAENAEAGDSEPEEILFNTESVTPEMYNEMKADITGFIDELNAIIRAKDYKAWRAYLDDDYYEYIGSPEYLQKVSSADIMQKNGIVLSTVNEYFVHVVVPSRYRDRVDDIEVTGKNRIKVITVDKGRRVLLYDLEKTKTGWKIVKPDSAIF